MNHLRFLQNFKNLEIQLLIHSCDLNDIKASPKNKSFYYLDNKLLIGKSDPMSEIYDVLLFARRDIEKAVIPSFIKKIGKYAFNCCNKLKEVKFTKDSQLEVIEEGAFSYSSFRKICDLL